MYTKRTHTIIWTAAAVSLAIAAVIYNPAHLFTAGIIFLFAIECGPEGEEDRRGVVQYVLGIVIRTAHVAEWMSAWWNVLTAKMDSNTTHSTSRQGRCQDATR